MDEEPPSLSTQHNRRNRRSNKIPIEDEIPVNGDNQSQSGSVASSSVAISSVSRPQTAQTIQSTPSNVTSFSQQQHSISTESPLPPIVQRLLGDRSNEKRKNAALEIEALIKSLQEANNSAMITSVISSLSKDFCTSANSNYRKGGLIGLAATAIGLMQNCVLYLDTLLPPVLHCTDDPEARVRYYACEALFNIAKVSRHVILEHFNAIFEGLTKLYADVDMDVKNGANLLDRLIKDIVTEGEAFHVEQFLPLLQNYIRRSNPYIRQLLVGWITLLDSIPDISMIDYLPDFLDGLFNMLSDSNREIRQAADSALSDFLREVSVSTVVEFGPIVAILVSQCHSKERLNRLTAITWLAELIHHPYSGGDALLPFHAQILGAIMYCISDLEVEIRMVAEKINNDLLALVRDTSSSFQLGTLLATLSSELLSKEDVRTKMAALRWINMLMEKRTNDMAEHVEKLLPILLRTLSDPSDAVVLLNLQVLSRISLAHREEMEGAKESEKEEAQFQLVLNAILNLFAADRNLLEIRGSLIIRKLCVLLNAKSVYIRMAEALCHYQVNPADMSLDDTTYAAEAEADRLEFISTMVQTLNLILLTASELSDLRSILATTFVRKEHSSRFSTSRIRLVGAQYGPRVFSKLFHCWCHNPISTFSLCLLAQAYELGYELIQRFSEIDVTVGLLMQVDTLVQLLESPIFVHMRLQLLDVDSPHHAPLLKSLYGLLMLIPQSDAFRSLNDRLTTVCNLRENLGMSQPVLKDGQSPLISKTLLNAGNLLKRFDLVMGQYQAAKEEADKVELLDYLPNKKI
mmetsp:Transcript_30458/g.46463  ORF Transcript_30458/g.46463 Transcript_30458/m.46463 type:complete len:804 (-) Transcript_30458:91-2502(-)|eukprot:CAMPEP_0194225570 /NCGR_PEP_ID=MMETSP0156-20130528/39909_1 /TAXON_ID=33649 /ORGANISM="Thalassionema nitzschioides, Strain L26-B" /LENGTH=803 /DNA_ID=CAMNT_0038957575 /DNA_START=21 /DNA_END=2432 /DNA_ORIENTATION=+